MGPRNGSIYPSLGFSLPISLLRGTSRRSKISCSDSHRGMVARERSKWAGWGLWKPPPLTCHQTLLWVRASLAGTDIGIFKEKLEF